MKKGVQKIYTEIAHRYDLINHVMTLGLDILWRKTAAREAADLAPQRILDVCCGTGDMSVEISRKVSPGTRVIGADFSLPMLRLASSKSYVSQASFVLSDVGCLPFPHDTFDLLAISFATRNLDSGPEVLEKFFREFYRVLKPGGIFVHLETSQPRIRLLRSLFHAYVRILVRPLGSRLSGSAAGYRYLAYTVPRFYPAEELSSLLKRAGFTRVDCRPFFFHVAALHTARKSFGKNIAGASTPYA
jgi:demethylmenaquinone methyltransferase/2-methoxy-6-polyprenyl-1,4-benzoquinol methylase